MEIELLSIIAKGNSEDGGGFAGIALAIGIVYILYWAIIRGNDSGKGKHKGKK